MSKLRAIVRPSLVPGFQLAGIETYGAEDVESAEDLITVWLETGERCLLALDDVLLAHLSPALAKRLDASDDVLIIGIPSNEPAGTSVTRSDRIAGMIRRSIGVHIAFGDERARRDS